MGCVKGGSMGHPSRNREESGAKDDLKCVWGGEAGSRGSRGEFSILSKDHSCDILVRNMAAFLSLSKESIKG